MTSAIETIKDLFINLGLILKVGRRAQSVQFSRSHLSNRPGGGREINLLEAILDGGAVTTQRFCSSFSEVPVHMSHFSHQPHPVSPAFALNFSI